MGLTAIRDLADKQVIIIKQKSQFRGTGLLISRDKKTLIHKKSLPQKPVDFCGSDRFILD